MPRTALDVGLRALPTGLLVGIADGALRLRHRALEFLRQREGRMSPLIQPRLASWDGHLLRRSILERREPWSALAVEPSTIPGMLTAAERQYYRHITKFFAGTGEAVELGPWLGLSTFHILNGLIANPHFQRRLLHVFDDFVWRTSWMSPWLQGSEIVPPENHGSFEHIFLQQMGNLSSRLKVARRRIAEYDGNQAIPTLTWNDGPIELLVVDCGRQLKVNEAWYEILSPHFIRDRTLIVMQDWQNCKNVPERHWENTKTFTDSKGTALDLVHEVRNAGVATFLYRG